MSKNAAKGTASDNKKKQDSKKAASKVSRYFRELKSEIKKVIWPDKKQIINNTLVVLAVVAVASVFIGLLDLLLGGLVTLVL